MNILKTVSLGAAFCMTAAIATAGTIDFTDESSWSVVSSTAITGTVDGITWTAYAIGGNFNFNDAPPGPIAPLAGDNDGVGITDDEVTFPNESIRLVFSSAVNLNLAYFLDLFSPEQVHIASNNGGTALVTSSILFNPMVDNGGFVTSDALTLTGTTFTFTGDNLNDPTAAPDFALAGLQVAAVPLPAGILLLGGALGALGFARRRKAAVA